MFGLPLHHIGIACSDIEKTAAFVRRAFVVKSDSGTVIDPMQNAAVRIFNEGEPGAIELVSGAAVIAVLKRKATYYHVCYLADDIHATVQQAMNSGALLVSKPTPAILFGNRRVAFIHTPLGLVEFLEAG